MHIRWDVREALNNHTRALLAIIKNVCLLFVSQSQNDTGFTFYKVSEPLTHQINVGNKIPADNNGIETR